MLTSIAHRAVLFATLAVLSGCVGDKTGISAAGSRSSQERTAGTATITGRPLIVVGIDREFPPYSFVDGQGQIAGFTVDLTRALAEVMAFDIEFRAGTYEQIIDALAYGEIDVIPHLSASEELEKRFAFTLPHLSVEDAIFVRSDTTGAFTESHLRNHPTLVWQAGAIEEVLEDDQLTGEILNATSVAETMRRLASGEGDCALVPLLTGLRLASELKLTNLRITGPPIKSYTRSLSFGVRSEDRELLERLDEGLTLVTTTDRFSALYNTWFGVQEPPIQNDVLRAWLQWISLPLLGLILAAVAWFTSLRRTVTRRTAELQESEERLQGILDNAPMMIYMKDADGRYLLVNRQFEKLVGRERQQMRNATDTKIFTRAQVTELRARDAQVINSGEILRCEEIFPTADGDRTFLTVRFPLHHADGRVYAVCAISADITEQKQAERESARSSRHRCSKLRSWKVLGVLAGGIAHDFNNLLMGILGNTLDMVRSSDLPPDSQAHDSAARRRPCGAAGPPSYANRCSLIQARANSSSSRWTSPNWLRKWPTCSRSPYPRNPSFRQATGLPLCRPSKPTSPRYVKW